MELNYYTYYHVRLDRNHVFYVGVGTKQPKGDVYRRSNNSSERNVIWKRIVSKTNYEVIILKHFATKLEALKQETRLIELFGIISEGGQLANIIKDSTNTVELGEYSRKPIYQYSMEGEYLNGYTHIGAAAKAINGHTSCIISSAKGKTLFYKKYQWRYYKVDKLEEVVSKKKIYQYSLGGEFIKEWDSIADASKALNILHESIGSSFPNKGCTTAGGFQWRREKYDKLKPVIKHSPRDHFKKLIYQYDKDYNLLNSYHGTSEVTSATGIHGTQIHKCCMKEKSYNTAGGYIWSYELLNK